MSHKQSKPGHSVSVSSEKTGAPKLEFALDTCPRISLRRVNLTEKGWNWQKEQFSKVTSSWQRIADKIDN